MTTTTWDAPFATTKPILPASMLDRFLISFGLSILVVAVVAFFLGGNESLFNLTGGFTSINVWLGLSVITALFLVLYVVKNYIL